MWHGYVLFEKPDALTMGQWATVAAALAGVLPVRALSSRPAYRLQARVALDKRKVLVEALFDARDLDVEDVTRLCRHLSEALEGAFTPEQVREGLRNHVTVFGAGSAWSKSRRKCRGYLQDNREEWEEGE